MNLLESMALFNCYCFPVKPKRIWPVPEPHLLVVCYSAVDFESFREVEDTVVPEVTEAFPSAPLILVATKCDLKDNSPTSSLHEEGRTIKGYKKSLKPCPLS